MPEKRKNITDYAASEIAVLSARRLFSCVIPGILLLISAATFQPAIISSVLMGEILARAEYYRELEVMRPQSKAQLDLEKLIA